MLRTETLSTWQGLQSKITNLKKQKEYWEKMEKKRWAIQPVSKGVDYLDKNEEKIWKKLSNSGLNVLIAQHLDLNRFGIVGSYQAEAEKFLTEIRKSYVIDEKLKKYVNLWEDFLQTYVVMSQKVEELNQKLASK